MQGAISCDQHCLCIEVFGDGFEHLSAKRYGEAIVAFSLAVDWRPESTKAKILLLFAEARQLVKDKKLDEARAKVQEYIDHGATCPILYPVGGDFKLLIDTFAQN